MSKQSTIAVTADLTGPAAAAVRYAWEGVAARFGFLPVAKGIRPHLKIVSGTTEAGRVAAIAETVDQLTQQLGTFTLHLEGVSSFDTASPFLFVRIIKTNELRRAYNHLYRRCTEAGLTLAGDYSPSTWIPHCLLTHGAISDDLFPAVRAYFRSHSFTWRCPAMTFNVVRVVEPRQEALHAFALRGVAETTERVGM